MKHVRLGDLLVNAGLLTSEQLERALDLQSVSRDRLGNVLIAEGMITEAQLIEAIKLQLGIEFINPLEIDISSDMAQIFSKNIAGKYGVLPIRKTGDTLYLAMQDPLNFVAVEEVRSATKLKIVPMIATEDSVQKAIEALYGNVGAARAIEEMKKDAELNADEDSSTFVSTFLGAEDVHSAPTIRLVNSVLERAVSERASDIHIEPREKELLVRMRIDGQLRTILTVPKNLQASVVARFKIIASMDIAERKIPQDGRANIRVKNSVIDLRVSTLPCIYGEKVVVRLLEKDSGLLGRAGIGLYGEDLTKFERLLKFVSGVVLIAGPTGSGKSSTMYTMIGELNKDHINLVTLEDPVEYDVKGCNQVQINEKTGMTFASGLRSVLRQDPDIIAIGEIRDGETAKIAMQSAITGHLVLSTIHTNDALSTIDRLLDIGIEPYLIAGALKAVISQRLVRKICVHCKEKYKPSPEEMTSIGLSPNEEVRFYKGKGCPMCNGTGYRGRTGVFEILILNKTLNAAISEEAGRDELEAILEKNGDFVSMAKSCRRLVLNGTTSLEEALKTINTTDV
ncbi:MAG: GspE/PulE family protein [Clostridia bacterium]|nr:GspE/PulE family protein [Clostridia bacterium]